MVSDRIQIKRNEELVKREVYCCFTPVVNFTLSNPIPSEAPFSWDDVENLNNDICDDCGQHEDATIHLEENENAHEFNREYKEIYEWWAVSPWLFKQLKEQGEPVIDTFPLLWGRTTTGQAIALDSVISDIQKAYKYAQGDEE